MEGADNRPEELINYYAKSFVAARNIASAAGFFALTWSTVVLLGGFVSVLTIKDFWSLSLLSLLMASQLILLEMEVRTYWDYVADIHILRLTKGQRYQLRGANRTHWVIILLLCIGLVVKIILAICITLPIAWFGPYVALALSVARLVQRDYADAGGDAANKAKLDAALVIFYALVIFHCLFVGYWGFLHAIQPWVLWVSKQYGFGDWGPEIVRRYWFKTRSKYKKDGLLPYNWNLITFSVGLLESASQDDLESASQDDRLWGARLLHTFIGKGMPIRQELLSSCQAIQNLIDMIIGPTRTDDPAEIRERAARIVADLASELRITKFPDTLRGICCLLENCKQYTELAGHKQVVSVASAKFSMRCIETVIKDMGPDLSWNHYSYVSKGTKELISQGLVILERLTMDEGNCIEIIKHQRLVSNITSPLSYHDFLNNGCDQKWVEMLGRSLTVLSRLIGAGPGEETTRLRHHISRNVVAIRNLLSILEVDSEGAFSELRGQAIEILAELATVDSFRKLAFDESAGMKEMLAKTLLCIFLEDRSGNAVVAEEDEEKHKKVRRKAGEALARLLRVPSARGNTDALTYAANANDIDLLPNGDMIDLLTKVVNQILSSTSKGEKAAHVVTLAGSSQPPNNADTRQSSTQETEEQSEDRKMLASMLSLTVAICNKEVISGDDFTRIFADDAALVKKLKEIVEMDKDATTDGWRIQKLVCQVVIAVVQLKPSCISEFNEHNFKEALSKALATMSGVDNCMLFSGNDREVSARSLASLVKEAQELLAQEQGDIIST